MKWTDDGIVISVRPFRERDQILTVLTKSHGRCAGLLRIQRVQQQPGNVVQAIWSARLPEHLGQWTLETERTPAAFVMTDGKRLRCLTKICQLVETHLPERHPYPAIFEAVTHLIEELIENAPAWPKHFVLFKLLLLQEVGFGLDLKACAATGQTEELIYISPKTGRAVSRAAGLPFHDKLLPLPVFLRDPSQEALIEDIENAARVCQFFLNKVVEKTL